ncbi:putative gustatory receptor 28b [Ischnura elegans]|uniref:putative gustatory receptor 28b n=1 Tax=Ischnura elegans TaxID=197161 RepID=UPI001ED8AC50|nr:putative gustatory receptor 28b [Ischnura elegans]
MIFDHRNRKSDRLPSTSENKPHYLTFYLLILSFQLLVYLSRIVNVCYSCHRVCSTAARTHVLLQEFQSQEMEDSASKELNIFCTQMESRSFEFSAAGFFVVDLKLLHSILGSLFTYLVILIQFQTP